MAERLIQRGAGNIQIIAEGNTNLLEFKKRSWERQEVKIIAHPNSMNENNISRIIKDISNFWPIEGIHVVILKHCDTLSDAVKFTNMLKDLDVVSRKQCPSLMYFGVMSADENIGHDICMARAKHYLPATNVKFSLSQPNKNFVNSPSTSTMVIMDTYERSLLSQEAVIKLQMDYESNPSLIQQIAAVANIESIEDISDELTLLDLGLDMEKSQTVFALLRNTYNITLDEETIPLLTLKRIREIEEKLTENKYEDTTGLSTFISFLDLDELLATTEIIFLPTRSTTSDMKQDAFEYSQTYLCIIPGLEGHHARFSTLCEHLKIPAFVLQSDLSRPHENIRETAQRYCNIMLDKMQNQNNFYILGYESGVLTALEMAAIFENNGLTGTIFCIGGGPTDIKILLEHYLPGFISKGTDAMKEAILKHMIVLMAGNEVNADLENTLQSNLLWNEKMEVCIRMIMGRVKYSMQYIRTQIIASFWRLFHTYTYNYTLQPLRSKIVVIKPANIPHIKNTPMSEKIEQLSKCSVAMHHLQTPLAYATYDLRCPSIVNHYLPESLLQDFEMKNLCETYLLDHSVFETETES